MTVQNREGGSIWVASLWMFVLSLLLGWLPFVGPAIAGVVGGLQAGTIGSALVAAIIPSLIVAAVIWLLGAVLDLAILGFVAGIGVFVVLLIGTLPLLGGALVGGYFAENRSRI